MAGRKKLRPKYRDPRAYKKQVLTTREVMYCLDCSKQTVLNYINRGSLDGHRDETTKCGKFYITKDSVIHFMGLEKTA